MIASLILALSATATAYWVETVANLTNDADEQTIATTLVKTVQGVIASKAFEEAGATTFGPESGESIATFDDLDDFDGLVACPPFDAHGAPLTQLPTWSVRIEVANYESNASGPSKLDDSADATLRGVSIDVEHDGRTIAHAFWLRARSPFE